MPFLSTGPNPNRRRCPAAHGPASHGPPSPGLPSPGPPSLGPPSLGLTVALMIAAAAPAPVPLLTAQAHAAAVRQIGTQELIRESRLVFHGRVIERESMPGPVGDGIVTRVVFEVLDVVRGIHASPTIDLLFLGGELNGMAMRIPDLVIPAEGEEGIYFVEQPGRFQVQPLYGWSQGHFVVQSSGRQAALSVFTNKLEGVSGLYSAESTREITDGHGRATGVRVNSRARGGNGAMSVEAFKTRIRELAAEITADPEETP